MSDKEVDTKQFEKIYGMLVYVQVQKPVPALQEQGKPKKPDEWKASVVITDEDFVDELEEYGSSLGTQLSLKKVKTEKFKELYKVDPPSEAGKNVWVFTLRKSTELGKTGKPVPDQFQPKVFEKQGKRLVDVTQTKLPANGSIGALSVDRFNRNDGKSSLYLKNVLVTDMIEYVRPEGSAYESGSEFEDEVDDGDSTPEPKESKPAAKSTKAKPKQESADDMDPF